MARVGWAPRGEASPVLDHLPHVYGAAVAATADDETAEAVTECVLGEAARGSGHPPADRRQLAAHAIVLAMRAAPADPFGSMAPADREAVALARLAGQSVAEIGATLGLEATEVKRRLRAGLEALAPPAEDSQSLVSCGSSM